MCGILPPKGNGNRASSPCGWASGGKCAQSSCAHPALCTQRPICARRALQASGSSFLAQDLQDEKWASMVKVDWHEAPTLMQSSQKGFGPQSPLAVKSKEKCVTFQPFASRFLPSWINPGWIKRKDLQSWIRKPSRWDRRPKMPLAFLPSGVLHLEALKSCLFTYQNALSSNALSLNLL